MKSIKTITAAILFASLFSSTILSQGNVGISNDNSEPDSSAMLDVKSSDKGVLVPRMSQSLRDIILNPATGLLIYNLNEKRYNYFDGNSWISIRTSPDDLWARNANDIYNTNSGKIGIGIQTPTALLHTFGNGSGGGNVLFAGDKKFLPEIPGEPPVTGAGTRLMWYPDKAAFRVGYVLSENWNKEHTGDFSVAMGRNTKASGIHSVALGWNTASSGNNSFAMGVNTISSGNNSFAFGSTSVASGDDSFAAGFSTNASGINSTALGSETEASGEFSTSMGYSTEASGDFSTAMGHGSIASGEHSIAMGVQTQATGEGSIAMGASTITFGLSSTAMGFETEALNAYSTAMGYGSIASGSVSTAMGALTLASGDFSTSLGQNTSAKSGYETVIGRYNTDYYPGSTDGWNPDDRLFVIGNGTGDGPLSSNAMTLLKNGNIGIGSDTPEAQLHTTGSVRFEGAGTPGFGMVLTSDALGNASWQIPPGLPSGNLAQTLRHDGTAWVASNILRNDGDGLAIYAYPWTNTQLYIYRPEGHLYGPGYSNLFARRGHMDEAGGGNSWGLLGIDAAIKGYSDHGNRYSAGIAGYSVLNYANSAAVIGSTDDANTFGVLGFRDAGSTLWAGYFKGDTYISGLVGIGTSNPQSLHHIYGNGSSSNPMLVIENQYNDATVMSFKSLNVNWLVGQNMLDKGHDPHSFAIYDQATDATRLVIRTNGNVGIGANVPSAQLHTTGTVRFEGAGTPGTGKVLTSDATGNATWQNASGNTYQAGDFAHGGVVFYVEPCGTKGLVCAVEDQSTGIYWCAGPPTYATMAKGNGRYAGNMNTSIIIAVHTAKDHFDAHAASVCADYMSGSYGDWYLPSKEELNLMYQNKELINTTSSANGGHGLYNDNYWNSTEGTSAMAWVQGFLDGTQFMYNKAMSVRVRAVRAF